MSISPCSIGSSPATDPLHSGMVNPRSNVTSTDRQRWHVQWGMDSGCTQARRRVWCRPPHVASSQVLPVRAARARRTLSRRLHTLWGHPSTRQAPPRSTDTTTSFMPIGFIAASRSTDPRRLLIDVDEGTSNRNSPCWQLYQATATRMPDGRLRVDLLTRQRDPAAACAFPGRPPYYLPLRVTKHYAPSSVVDALTGFDRPVRGVVHPPKGHVLHAR